METGSERQYVICSDCMGEGCAQCQDGEVLDGGPVGETDANALFRSYRWLRDYHVLPVDGGMVAQSARFLAAVDFIDLSASRAREKAEEVREKKEKLRAQLSRKTGVKRGR